MRLAAVPPEQVGRWACVAELADGAPAGTDPDGDGPLGREYRTRLSEVRFTPGLVALRRDFAAGGQDGSLVFVAGRAARPGEAASASPCRDLVAAPR